MSMRLPGLVGIVILFATVAHAQSGIDVVRNFYKETLAATQNARTREEIVSLVERADASDWVSISPEGQIVQTRPQTLEALQTGSFPDSCFLRFLLTWDLR